MPNDKPLSFMVFPQLSLEIREFLYKVVLTYIQGIDVFFSGNLWTSATSTECAKSLYIRISRFFMKGPRKLSLCSIDVFLNADCESPHMT